jgi:hypothetical protein
MLSRLRRITLPRPPGAVRALALAATDVPESKTLIGAYGDIPDAEFKRDFLIWNDDDRAGRAFAAIEACDCA